MSKLKLKKTSIGKITDSNISQVISKIYDDINELINDVNNEFGNLDSRKGKEGNIKIKKVSGGIYQLQAKTSDGWSYVDLTLKESEE